MPRIYIPSIFIQTYSTEHCEGMCVCVSGWFSCLCVCVLVCKFCPLCFWHFPNEEKEKKILFNSSCASDETPTRILIWCATNDFDDVSVVFLNWSHCRELSVSPCGVFHGSRRKTPHRCKDVEQLMFRKTDSQIDWPSSGLLRLKPFRKKEINMYYC